MAKTQAASKDGSARPRADPQAEIRLLDGEGERILMIMKDGVFYRRPSTA